MKTIQFIGKKTGKLLVKFELSESEYRDFDNENHGLCILCGALKDGHCEPDARHYPCDDCERNGVYGIQELLVMGFISLSDIESYEEHA